MAPKIERVLEGLVLGEGPHWDVGTQSLYFVDVFAKEIHRYVPSTSKHTKASLPDKNVAFIIPVEGQIDKFIITQDREISIVTWDGESPNVKNIQALTELDSAPETLPNKVNDGKCDGSGRLWTGTIAEIDMKTLAIKAATGSVYSLGPNKDLKRQVKNIGLSNGLAFNATGNKFYYIDSYKNTVEEYDLDIPSGKISCPKVILTLAKHDAQDGLLDGMTIDTEGNLWIAVFNRSEVIKVDPKTPEKILESIKLPAKQTTSVIFGGPNLDELYVTSGCYTINDQVLPRPENGALYRITGIGSKGFPGNKYKL